MKREESLFDPENVYEKRRYPLFDPRRAYAKWRNSLFDSRKTYEKQRDLFLTQKRLVQNEGNDYGVKKWRLYLYWYPIWRTASSTAD